MFAGHSDALSFFSLNDSHVRVTAKSITSYVTIKVEVCHRKLGLLNQLRS